MSREIITYLLLLGCVAFLAGAVEAYPLTAALNSMQVVPLSSSTAKGSCRVDAAFDDTVPIPPLSALYMNVNCEFSGLSGALIDADIRSARSAQNGEGLCNDGRAVWVTLPNTGSGNVKIDCRFIRYIDLWTWTTKDFYIVLQTSNFPDGEVRGQIKPATLDYDVDGEGKSEVSVFRPSDGTAYSYCSMLNSTIQRQLTWRPETDGTPFLADFDGDGIGDWSFVRTDPANGNLSIFYTKSSSDSLAYVRWGNANLGDLLVFGDYDGIGKVGAAVFRTSEGVWYILPDFNFGGINARREVWGQPGGNDKPCTGDFDGDGITDLCIVRNEGGQLHWYIRRSSNHEMQTAVWGIPTDEVFPNNPVDVDADGINDILVSRVDNGQRYFYALQSSDLSWFFLPWGLGSDQVKIGDFNGDGRSDFAAIRDVDNHLVWFINQGLGDTRTAYWGLTGDK